MTTVVEEHSVSEMIGSLSAIPNPDYSDLFTARTSATASPEQWARAAIEQAAGLRGQLLWRGVLGLRLAWRGSPEHIAGWRIAARGDDWITLLATSWFMTASIVVCVEGHQVSVATLVRYERPPAALVWPPLSLIHRRAVPGLLRHAARCVASTENGA